MPVIDCGIDIGSTNVKAVLVGEDGQVHYSKSVPSPRIDDGVGLATDALALVGNLEELIIEGWRKVGGGEPLRSITTSGIGEDGLGLDKDLIPTGPAIAWFDRRAETEAENLQSYVDLFARTANRIDATRTAAKWLWLHKHRREELVGDATWITLTDFPLVRWSGEPFMSISLAPRTACYDVYKREWVEELLLAAHAPPLPPIVSAGRIVGYMRSGPLRASRAASSRTIVVAAGHDHPIAASAIRRFIPNARVDSLGTANLIYGETTSFDRLSETSPLALSTPPGGAQGLSCLGVVELNAELAAINKTAEDLRDCLTQPKMHGEPPHTQDELNSKLGNSGTQLRRCLERAALKGRNMMFEMSRLKVPPAPIYATGGWSRSKALVELRASIFAEPVNVVGDVELTALGAALFGAQAAGATPSCPFRREDIETIDPLLEWITEYQLLSHE